jgi:hypothetical protein
MQPDQSDSVPSALQVRTCIPQLPQPRACGVQHAPHAHELSQLRLPPSPHAMFVPGAQAP